MQGKSIKNSVSQFLEKNENIKYIDLLFFNSKGRLKKIVIPVNRIDYAIKNGIGFDSSSVRGFGKINDSDLTAKPRTETIRKIAWDPETAAMVCNIHNPDGTRFEGDPLYLLEKQYNEAKKLGFNPCMGLEVEFFLFSSFHPMELEKAEDIKTKLLDNGRYCDLENDNGTFIRNKIASACEVMGVRIDCSHHERAPSQHELDIAYGNCMDIAINGTLVRYILKKIAQDNNVVATVMPKPIFGENGSGLHIHQSLFNGNKNCFFDPNNEHRLSKTAKFYTAGVLKHSREIIGVINSSANSFQRLVPHHEAPTKICWGLGNRSTIIRRPNYYRDNPNAARVEFRAPDFSGNIPIVLALILASGLDGIRNKHEIGDPEEEDVYKINKKIESLPANLSDATRLMEKNEFVKSVLGPFMHDFTVEWLKKEWKEYKLHATPEQIRNHEVTNWEIQRYLSL